jgi:hypothetical protein
MSASIFVRRRWMTLKSATCPRLVNDFLYLSLDPSSPIQGEKNGDPHTRHIVVARVRVRALVNQDLTNVHSVPRFLPGLKSSTIHCSLGCKSPKPFQARGVGAHTQLLVEGLVSLGFSSVFRAQTKGGRSARQQHRKLYFTYMYLGNYYLPQTKRSRSARQHHRKGILSCYSFLVMGTGSPYSSLEL